VVLYESIGTTVVQVQQAETGYAGHRTGTRPIGPQLCSKFACSTSALAFSDRYPILHLNGFKCLLNAQHMSHSTLRTTTHLTNDPTYSPLTPISLPFSSTALPRSIVAIRFVIKIQIFASAKNRPGQILLPNPNTASTCWHASLAISSGPKNLSGLNVFGDGYMAALRVIALGFQKSRPSGSVNLGLEKSSKPTKHLRSPLSPQVRHSLDSYPPRPTDAEHLEGWCQVVHNKTAISASSPRGTGQPHLGTASRVTKANFLAASIMN